MAKRTKPPSSPVQAVSLLRPAGAARREAAARRRSAAAATRAAEKARVAQQKADKKAQDAAYKKTAGYLESLSAAYRKRIERARAKGKSTQGARGHKPKEHVSRRQRELQEAALSGRVTTSQRSIIRKFVKEAAYKSGQDPDEVWDDYQQFFFDKGWSWFTNLRERQRALHNAWVAAGKPWGGLKLGPHGGMENFEKDAQRYEAETWMMYYH